MSDSNVQHSLIELICKNNEAILGNSGTDIKGIDFRLVQGQISKGASAVLGLVCFCSLFSLPSTINFCHFAADFILHFPAPSSGHMALELVPCPTTEVCLGARAREHWEIEALPAAWKNISLELLGAITSPHRQPCQRSQCQGKLCQEKEGNAMPS